MSRHLYIGSTAASRCDMFGDCAKETSIRCPPNFFIAMEGRWSAFRHLGVDCRPSPYAPATWLASRSYSMFASLSKSHTLGLRIRLGIPSWCAPHSATYGSLVRLFFFSTTRGIKTPRSLVSLDCRQDFARNRLVQDTSACDNTAEARLARWSHLSPTQPLDKPNIRYTKSAIHGGSIRASILSKSERGK
jgi:hypothetical protein